MMLCRLNLSGVHAMNYLYNALILILNYIFIAS